MQKLLTTCELFWGLWKDFVSLHKDYEQRLYSHETVIQIFNTPVFYHISLM